MPKFTMSVIEEATMLPNGVMKPARVALVPLDDAAKITPQARDAQAIGAWLPKDPAERAKAADRLAEAHVLSDMRKGKCDAEGKDARKKRLLAQVYKI